MSFRKISSHKSKLFINFVFVESWNVWFREGGGESPDLKISAGRLKKVINKCFVWIWVIDLILIKNCIFQKNIISCNKFFFLQNRPQGGKRRNMSW